MHIRLSRANLQDQSKTETCAARNICHCKGQCNMHYWLVLVGKPYLKITQCWSWNLPWSWQPYKTQQCQPSCLQVCNDNSSSTVLKCGREVLFETCVAMNFVDDDDDDVRQSVLC